MSNWIRFDKSSWGLSGSIVIFNTICLYAGKTDHWGISAAVNLYDRSISFEILNLYAGIEIWYKR
jgi:hypothetical protein